MVCEKKNILLKELHKKFINFAPYFIEGEINTEAFAQLFSKSAFSFSNSGILLLCFSLNRRGKLGVYLGVSGEHRLNVKTLLTVVVVLGDLNDRTA